MSHRQNVPRDKTSQGKKRPKGQNVPSDKMSQGKKHPKGQNFSWDKPCQWTNEAHYLTCVANYLIQKNQDKGMTKPNLPIN